MLQGFQPLTHQTRASIVNKVVCDHLLTKYIPFYFKVKKNEKAYSLPLHESEKKNL